jgi:hypothetical protein
MSGTEPSRPTPPGATEPRDLRTATPQGTTALDVQIAVTFFSNYAAASRSEELISPRALARRIQDARAPVKERLPWLKLARFGELRTVRGSLRHDKNVLAVTGAELDYDGERVPFDAAVECLRKQGVLALAYASPSHHPEAPRWRVLVPFGADAQPHDRETLGAFRARFLGRLSGLLRMIGADASRESWVLSQSFYYGGVGEASHHRVVLIDGPPITEHDELDRVNDAPIDSYSSPKAKVIGEPRASSELARLIAAAGELHNPTLALAARLVGEGVKAETVLEILQGLMLAAPDRDPAHEQHVRWQARYDDLDRLITSAGGLFPVSHLARKAIARVAGRLIRRGADAETLKAEVMAIAEEHNVTEAQAEDIVRWVADRHLSAVGGARHG